MDKASRPSRAQLLTQIGDVAHDLPAFMTRRCTGDGTCNGAPPRTKSPHRCQVMTCSRTPITGQRGRSRSRPRQRASSVGEEGEFSSPPSGCAGHDEGPCGSLTCYGPARTSWMLAPVQTLTWAGSWHWGTDPSAPISIPPCPRKLPGTATGLGTAGCCRSRPATSTASGHGRP